MRAAFDIPRIEDLKLRDYPTLASVIGFVRTQRPDLALPTTDPSTSSGHADRRPTTKEEAPIAVAAPSSFVPSPSSDPVTETVLAIVAEKTGYPTEMLELELDLEADLGVDTVKQAETFAAVRAAFDIPRIEDLKLRDYPTLASVIQFVRDHKPELATEPRTKNHEPSAVAQMAETPAAPVLGSLEEANRAPRRVPVPALRPALELCKPSGVTLEVGSRVIVAADRGGVGKVLINRLERRGVTVCELDPQHDAVTLEAQLHACLADGPVQGVYWLPALDTEPALEAMSPEQWHDLNRVRAKNLHLVMHTLLRAGEPPFLVAGSRLGGLHGYGEAGASAPLGGAVMGFTKAYKREQTSILVKAVDFEPGRKTAEPAELLLAETLADPGVVEVGYHNGLRYTVTLEEQPLPAENPGLTLDSTSVVLVTGAAGGITSAIVADLAAASGANFYLLDLTPEPSASEPNIALFRSDREALKRKLIDDLKAAGERPTPVMIDRQIMAIERSEAALRAIEAVQAAGGTVHYRSINLLDDAAVAAVIDDVRARYGKIDVLLHAGGIEISRALADKTAEEFGRVFDIKANGFYSLLHAAAGLPIGATVAFSSVAGRFGNSGQTDYSAANDLLCKITSSMRAWRPDTRAIVIDWTAWGGIGMATRGSIPKIMEMAGIDMLPPEVGIPTIRRELTGGDFCGEMVVGQRLGILTEEFDPTGGLDPDKVLARLATEATENTEKKNGSSTSVSSVSSVASYLMLGKVVAARLYGGLEVETELDPQVQPFLYDHQIDGIPVLPGVMGTEAFAELASVFAPGYRIATIHEQFHSPFKFYRNEPRTLRLSARVAPGCDGTLLAHTTLRSLTPPARPGLPARDDLHFTATIQLTAAPTEVPVAGELPGSFMEGQPDVREFERSAIYKVYFHGPAYQVLQRALVNGNRALGVMPDHLLPNSVPANAPTLVAPRLIELCFQTAGIWEMANKRVMALPLGIGAVTVYRQPEQANGARLYALVTAVDGGASFDARVLDESGNVYVDLRGYRTVQLPGSVTL